MPKTVQVQVRQIGASTSEGSARNHKVLIDRPQDKGGADKGPLGGELLLLSLGGCFMSTLLAAIRAREAPVSNVQVTVEGSLESSPERFVEMSVKVRADHSDAELVRKLLKISELGCIVTNTLKKIMPVAAVLED